MKRRYAVPVVSAVVMVLASVLAAPSAHAEQSATWDLPRDKDVVARFGFGSDIHVGRDSGKYGSAVDKLKNALNAYRQSGVDAVGFSGDLTDSGQVGQYQTLMDTLNTGTDDSEQVILAMGNHETLDAGVSDSPQRFKKYTGQDMNKLVEVNGVDVITMGPQNEDDDYRADYDFLKTTLDRITSRANYDPNRPIFVLTHHGVQNTAYVTNEWYGEYGAGTDHDLVKLMQQYPQIIQVSGHSHATLEDARSIDQSLGYTSIQDGTIGAYFENESGKVDPITGTAATRPADSELASQGLLVDVYRDGTVKVHRMNFATGTWIYPDEPWIITADGAKANVYGKNRPSTPAMFPDGASVSFDTAKTTGNSAAVTFPAAKPADGTNNNMIHSYRITMTPKNGGETVYKSVFNDYYYAKAGVGAAGAVPTQKSRWSVTVKGLTPQTEYTATVEALTSFEEENGAAGAVIASGQTSVTTNEAPAPSPMFDVDFGSGSADDYYAHQSVKQGGVSTIEDNAELGQQVLHVRGGDGGYRYTMEDEDYNAIANGFTTDVVFSIADVQKDQCVFSNQQNAGFGFEVENGKLEFWLNAGSGRAKPAVAIQPDTWYHASAVYDGNTVTLYLNGEKVDSASAKSGLVIPSNGAKYFFIGADTSGSGAPEYQMREGYVALARISSQVFSDDEVAASYTNAMGDGPAAKQTVRQALTAAKRVVEAGQGNYSDATWSAFADAYTTALVRVEDFRAAPADLNAAAVALRSAQQTLQETNSGDDGNGGNGGDGGSDAGGQDANQPGGSHDSDSGADKSSASQEANAADRLSATGVNTAGLLAVTLVLVGAALTLKVVRRR